MSVAVAPADAREQVLRRLVGPRPGWDATATAIAFREGTLSYADLRRLADAVAGELDRRGIGYDSRVVVALPDSPHLVALLLGVLRSGAVAVPVSPKLPLQALAAIVRDCRPRGVVCEAGHVDAVVTVAAEVGRPCAVATMDVDGGPADLGWVLPGTDRHGEPPAWVCDEDAAVVQYTSGSTGQPKGVVHTYAGLQALMDGYPSLLGLTPDDRCLSAAKISFGYGFGNSVVFPLGAGASVVLHDGMVDPMTFVDLCARYRPTVVFGVPSLFASVLRLRPARLGGAPFRSVRRFVSAGERLDGRLHQRWQDAFGVEIVEGFGSTECLHICVSNRPGETRPGSVGRVVPGYELAIVGDDGSPLGPGCPGQLVVRGAATAARYWNRRDEDARVFRAGWVHTGDVASADEEGWVWVLGRRDDVLKVGAAKVAPTEIEACIAEDARVAHVAVVGSTDEDGVTGIVAYVVAPDAADAQGLRRELRDRVRRELGAAKTPGRFELVPALPTTVTGKLSRRRLRATPPAGAAGGGPTGRSGERQKVSGG